ncbi:glycosyltransferase family 29 protein [Enterobacter ludwigii]|uniref:glycosyltransferase family 29 protein n=1 Tax=Enterobacter ludwigii TaxID=299767 RepID=UPI003F6F0A38
MRNFLFPSIPFLEREVADLKQSVNEINYSDEGALLLAWIYDGGRHFISEVEMRLHSPYYWRYYSAEHWMICFCILLGARRRDLVSRFFPVYLSRHGYSVVPRYFPVVAYLSEMGCDDDSVQRSCMLYGALQKNRERNVIQHYFSGKRVAVVGNGPSELGAGRGREIDGYDIVVRFNNYDTRGFEGDYGVKTDVWVRGGGGDVIDREDISRYDLVIWEPDYEHHPVDCNHLDVLQRHIQSNSSKCCYFDFENHHSLRERSGIAFPSTGLIAVWVISRIVGVENIGLYGFSFKEENARNINEHYFGDRTVAESRERAKTHDMQAESAFLHELMSR